MANDPFHIDNVKRFAAAWYQALDVHAPTADLARLLVDDGLKMIFPEKTLVGMGDFEAWYAGGTYSDGEQAPGVINIFFDEVHVVKSVSLEPDADGAVVDVVVGWQASWFTPPAAKSTRTAMDATQRWTLRRCADDKNPFGLEITSYNAMAKPFVYAPGFATL
jgi:hypothetical protein